MLRKLALMSCLSLSVYCPAWASPEQSNKRFFIENKGQWQAEVLFETRLNGLDAWITRQGVVYDFFALRETATPDLQTQLTYLQESPGQKRYSRYGQVVRMTLSGALPAARPAGTQKSEGYYNYFTGSDPSKWASQVCLFEGAWVKNVYSGIDLHYYFEGANLRYDYVLAAGADPAQIAMDLEGADGRPGINESGELEFATRFGTVKQARLFAYQETKGIRKQVSCSFCLDKQGLVRFALGSYDRRLPLVIDPLIYSTYLGGNDYDEGYAITKDASGSAYVAGFTSSLDFPTTPGAYQTGLSPLNSGSDVFVTKLNPSGNALVFSTFLGGNGAEQGRCIEVDTSGNIYLSGITTSVDFPITAGAYQSVNADSFASFALKLNAAGSVLEYSTYLGGDGTDAVNGMAVDGSGNVYISGVTGSSNFPVTTGVVQPALNGITDVFVTKLNAGGATLGYSTYLGGSEYDYVIGMALDGLGNAYITGGSGSPDYPTTAGAFQRTFGGTRDGFVTKLNAAGTALTYSTFLGGDFLDAPEAIALDASGSAYVTGYTKSSDFPVTPGAYQAARAGINSDAFITKLNPGGTALTYSTLLGGDDENRVNAIVVDGSGNAYVAGMTNSTNFPVTAGAVQSAPSGSQDVFVTKLNGSGTRLAYSTLLAGSGNDWPRSIRLDSPGILYVTGRTESQNFPTTPGAYKTSKSGNSYDAFVAKIGLTPTGVQDQPFESFNWSVFPNPNQGTFTISASEPADFELSDVQGRVLQVHAVKYPGKTVSANLAPGFYFLRCKANGQVSKMVVE